MKLNYGTLGYKGLSYSRREDFCRCPRKFEISHALGLAKRKDSVTFSYGHAVGAGVQEWFKTQDLDRSIVAAVLNYSMDWDNEGTAKEKMDKKSLWYAIQAIENFHIEMNKGLYGNLTFLKDYELCQVLVAGKQVAGIELEFILKLDYDFVYEGHIDMVLRHKQTRAFLVIEVKTTKLREPHPAQYANSDQALGYSIVLDAIAHSLGEKGAASYKVAYLIYSSSEQKWILMHFPKSAKQRFNWLNNVMRDVDLIYNYQQAAAEGIPYPTRGGSCYDFYRECEYFNLCGMENETLLRLSPPSKEDASFEEVSRAHFEFTLEDVIAMQVELAEERNNLSFQTSFGDLTI